jgi:hypothetical protein
MAFARRGAQIGKAFPKSPRLLCQQLRDPVDELFGGVDRRAGAVERYIGIGPQPVIGDRLDVVGLGQELAQRETEPRLGLVSRANWTCTPLWVLASLPVRSAINACAA